MNIMRSQLDNFKVQIEVLLVYIATAMYRTVFCNFHDLFWCHFHSSPWRFQTSFVALEKKKISELLKLLNTHFPDSLTCNWYLLWLFRVLNGIIGHNQWLIYMVFVQSQWLEVFPCNFNGSCNSVFGRVIDNVLHCTTGTLKQNCLLKSASHGHVQVCRIVWGDRKRLCKVPHHHLCKIMSLHQWRALPSSSPLPFPGSQEIPRSARMGASSVWLAWEMPVGLGCLVFMFQKLSPLTKSHPNIKCTSWMSDIQGYISPEILLLGTAGFTVAHLPLKRSQWFQRSG